MPARDLATCASCPAYAPHGGLLSGKGVCHAHPSDAAGKRGAPEVQDDFYCMEHPANRKHFA